MEKKHHSHFLAAASAVLLLAGGCRPESAMGPGGEEGIVIRLTLSGMQTRSEGTDDENAVNTLDVFIFSADGNTQYYYNHEDSPTLSGVCYEQASTVAGLTALTGTDEQKADALREATVFAIANYNGGETLGNKTLAALKALTVDASEVLSPIDVLEEDSFKKEVAEHPVFVMTAEGGLSKNGNEISATLSLQRLMSKFTLDIAYVSSIVKEGEDDQLGHTETTWTPIQGGENIRVYLENAVSNARLDAGMPAGGYTFFTYADTYPTAAGEGLSSPALYSYPQAWTTGSNKEPFIKLIQPWHYVTTIERNGKEIIIDENVVELYYKIMLPDTRFVSNTWYRPKVTLNVLGGEATRPTHLVPTYFRVLEWGTASDVDEINVAPPKYLVPEARHITVHNGNPLKVKFYASGEVVMVVEKIYKMVYRNALMVEREIYPTRHSEVNDIYDNTWVTLTNINNDETYGNEDDNIGYINLNHQLSDNFDNNAFAARPYIYIIKIRLNSDHPDEAESWKTVEITQEPPIMVEGQLSAGFVSVNGVVHSAGKTHPDNTALTGQSVSLIKGGTQYYHYAKNSDYTSSTNQIGSVATYTYLNPANNNSSRYRIIIEAPTESGKYVVDPRVTLSSSYGDLENCLLTRRTSSSLSSSQNHTPLDVDDDDLTSYRPAGRESDDYIAPEFMFASSYGKTTSMRYPAAVLRCAAYQEDGYPAGRWRLPTKAEIQLCMRLQQKKAIPNLFLENPGGDTYDYNTGKYIAASGAYWGIVVNQQAPRWGKEEDADMGKIALFGPRCVYDTWYWGREEVDDCIQKDSGGDYVTTGEYTETITEAGTTETRTHDTYVYQWGGYHFSND